MTAYRFEAAMIAYCLVLGLHCHHCAQGELQQVVAVELNQDVQPFSQLTLCTFSLVNYSHDYTSAFEKMCKISANGSTI